MRHVLFFDPRDDLLFVTYVAFEQQFPSIINLTRDVQVPIVPALRFAQHFCVDAAISAVAIFRVRRLLDHWGYFLQHSFLMIAMMTCARAWDKCSRPPKAINVGSCLPREGEGINRGADATMPMARRRGLIAGERKHLGAPP